MTSPQVREESSDKAVSLLLLIYDIARSRTAPVASPVVVDAADDVGGRWLFGGSLEESGPLGCAASERLDHRPPNRRTQKAAAYALDLQNSQWRYLYLARMPSTAGDRSSDHD